MQTNYLGLSIGFVLLVFIFPVDALGQTNSDRVEASFGWKISTFFQDFYIDAFVTDKQDRADAIAKQAIETQERIDELATEGKPIPNEFVERVEKRLDKVEIILEEIKDDPKDEKSVNDRIKTDTVVKELRKVDEANQLRLLVNDFNELRAGADSGKLDSATLKIRANQIDSKANNLDLVIQNCDGRINSLELAFEESPYSVLQNKCTILQNHSLEDAKKRLNLVGSDID